MAQFLDLFGFLSVVLRGIILALCSVTIGGLLFTWVCAPVLRTPQPDDFSRVLSSSRRIVLWAASVLLLAEVIWLALNTAILMSTAALTFAQCTGAGYFHSGIVMLAGVAAAVIVAVAAPDRRWVILPVLLMAAAEASTSHAVARLSNGAIATLATGLHQTATGAWIGSLPVWLLAIRATQDGSSRPLISRRFSRLAQFGFFALLLSGATLFLIYVRDPQAVYGTAYGVMVVAKAVLLAMIAGCAYLNHQLVSHPERGSPAWLSRLRRFGEVEVGIGFTAILAAASLTSQPPAVDLTADRVSLHQIADRFRPEVPRLTTPPLESLSPSAREAWKETHRTNGEAYVPGSEPYQPPTEGDIAWSEYNHHWAGVVVMAVGVLAVLWRNYRVPWAQHWPLAFFGLAVFLLLRADPETWPLGPSGFWESFTSADVAQHRMFVLLIVLFAIFEWGVATGRLRSRKAALVFPLVCAAGGAALLTHTHALSNIREELLAEMSHLPLALLAVAAGWSRWLELRLPPGTAGWPARVWPVCFVGIGAVLLLYREA